MEVADLQEHDFHLFLLGPGYGESILLRVPPAHWVVVDCFRWRPSNGPGRTPALDLLRSVGARVDGIFLTHPHDDHAPGLSRIVEFAPEAWVGCCEPLWLEPPPTGWGDDPDLERTYQRDCTATALAAIHFAWRSPDRRWDLTAGSSRKIGEAVVTVLYPDDEARRRTGITDLNQSSSPLLVEWHNLRLVLGADLPAREWRRVAAHTQVNRHHALKVSHHASRGSVTDVLTPDTPSRLWIATPWNRKTKLPRFEDGEGVSEILRQVHELNLTALPTSPARPLPSRRVTRPELLAVMASPADPDLEGVEFELLEPPSEPMKGWIRASFTASGEVSELRRGLDSLTIAEGP